MSEAVELSPQMRQFNIYIASARAGNKKSIEMVRGFCRIAVDKAPDADLCLIAEAIVGVSHKFAPADEVPP